MNKIYVVVSGYYSDWTMIGYFTNELDAMKYCADNGGCYYYEVVDNLSLTDKQKDIRLRYYHEVVFDYNKYTKTVKMRDEKDRYKYYKDDCKKDKKISCTNRWIAFELFADTREQAEKISQDLMSEILYNVKVNDIPLKKSIELVGESKGWKCVELF